MRSDLDVRLARALTGMEPTPQASARARSAVLASVAPLRRARARIVVVALAGAATIVAGAGVAGQGYLTPGSRQVEVESPDLVVPDGTSAVTTLAGGRAWVATSSGRRTSRPATAVEVSPAGLFVAYGERDGLVAAELDGDVRWRIAVAGEVVRIAWAPYPTYIAYVVRRGGQYDLRLIWANGRHDRLVARNVAAARPRWRPDTGAIDFVRSDGRVWTWEREPDLLRVLPG